MCTVQDGVRRAVAPHHRLHHPRYRGSRRQHSRVCRHIQVTVDIIITSAITFFFKKTQKQSV